MQDGIISHDALPRAISLTMRTLEDRSRSYRNLVIAVSATTIGSITIALILTSWLPLFGFGLAIPLVWAFAILDTRRVATWRKTLLLMHQAEGLSIDLFRTAMLQLKHLPQQTVQAMVATLDVVSPAT